MLRVSIVFGTAMVATSSVPQVLAARLGTTLLFKQHRRIGGPNRCRTPRIDRILQSVKNWQSDCSFLE